MLSTANELCEIAQALSHDLTLKDRILMGKRPRICPFHVLLDFVEQDSSVLDIGCGSGLWLFLLARLNRIASGWGVEVRSEKIALANSIKRENDPLAFLTQNPTEPWPQKSPDSLSMIDVLHHIPPPEQKNFILRIKATQARRIIFKDIDPTAKIKSGMNTLHDLVLSQQKPTYCRKEKVAHWLEEMGYRIQHLGRHDMLWYSHYLIVADKTT